MLQDLERPCNTLGQDEAKNCRTQQHDRNGHPNGFTKFEELRGRFLPIGQRTTCVQRRQWLEMGTENASVNNSAE